jgi:hypothetical protein
MAQAVRIEVTVPRLLLRNVILWGRVRAGPGAIARKHRDNLYALPEQRFAVRRGKGGGLERKDLDGILDLVKLHGRKIKRD